MLRISDLQIRDSLAVLEALLVKYTVANLEIGDFYKIIDPLSFFVSKITTNDLRK